MKPFAATASVVPCRTGDEAETTSVAVRAHGGDVLIARRPQWYVSAATEKDAEWCVIVLYEEKPAA